MKKEKVRRIISMNTYEGWRQKDCIAYYYIRNQRAREIKEDRKHDGKKNYLEGGISQRIETYSSK
jgi:hypothetical protein